MKRSSSRGSTSAQSRPTPAILIARHVVNEVPELAPYLGVDARGRLVEQQQLRVMQHASGERETLLPAGAPVVSLLPPQNIFVRFFIPEPELARAHVGDKVALECDSCPEHLSGPVSFIAPQPEYTPPFIYSDSPPR